MMLSEISQSQKEKHCMIPIGYLIKLIKAESGVVVTRDGQEGKMSCYFHGFKTSVIQDKF